MMLGAAWSVLLMGLLAAGIVSAQGCGTWGLTCLSYAFFVFLGTTTVSTALFWRYAATREQRSKRWYLSCVMAALTSTFTITGLFILALVLQK